MKISYHACQNRVSVSEHFLNAMISTYEERYLDRGFIHLNEPEADDFTQKLQQLILIRAAFKPKLKGIA